jgi:hypothetical protein
MIELKIRKNAIIQIFLTNVNFLAKFETEPSLNQVLIAYERNWQVKILKIWK